MQGAGLRRISPRLSRFFVRSFVRSFRDQSCSFARSSNTQNTATYASATDWISTNIDPSVDHLIPPLRYTVNGNTKYGKFQGVVNVKGVTQEKMPNCGLPRQGDICLSLGETNDIIFQYSLEHAGANRDFVSVAGQSWGIKLELDHQKDHCKNEWLLYTTLPHLREIAPPCFGFAKFVHEGKEIHALMVEQITFTVDAILADMRMSNHTFELEQLLAHLVVKTVAALTYLAQEGLVCCRDWHTRNIAFSNVSTVAELSDMRLINWTGHNMEPCTSGRDRMARAMGQFIKLLPGQAKYSAKEAVEKEGTAAPSLSCANLQEWDTRINHTVTTLGTWWNSLVDVPSSQQLDELRVLLLPADADEGMGTASDKNPYLNGNRAPHEEPNNNELFQLQPVLVIRVRQEMMQQRQYLGVSAWTTGAVQ